MFIFVSLPFYLSLIHFGFIVIFIPGKWTLVDGRVGLGLVNRFNAEEVYKCYIHWGPGRVNLELWSEERPVSKQSPLRICHEYEVINID